MSLFALYFHTYISRSYLTPWHCWNTCWSYLDESSVYGHSLAQPELGITWPPSNPATHGTTAQTQTGAANCLILCLQLGSVGAKRSWVPKPHVLLVLAGLLLLFLFVKYLMEYFWLSHSGKLAITIQAEPLEKQSFVSHFYNSFIMFRTFRELDTTNVINEDTEAMAWVMLGLCACCNFGKTRNMWERGFFFFFKSSPSFAKSSHIAQTF